jgi:hypothetical protein
MMEAARTSETSVDIQLRTRQYILEDSELHEVLCHALPPSSGRRVIALIMNAVRTSEMSVFLYVRDYYALYPRRL